ncbi:MAG: efflux RND transporter permease subunit [Acetobacteraceae bacterium]|nr:efflux RND transporter permease subunit [Acetobacteraceae bacterium]
MFNALVTASLNNRLLVLILALLLIAYGGFSLTRLPVDVFPDLNRPTVTLMTEAEGLAPEEVEQSVTYPLESAMNGMPGVTRVRSVSSVGLSIVYVEFAWNTDIYLNRQQIAERLVGVRAQMPAGVAPQMGPITSIMGEVMLVSMSANPVPGGIVATPMELRELADFTLRPRLLAIAGVAQVIPIGGEVRQFQITPDIAAMSRLDVTLDDVERAIKQFGTNTGGGFVDQNRSEYVIRNIGRTASLEDLGRLVVTLRAGQAVLLGQVAKLGHAPRFKRGDAGANGKPAVIVSVQKQPGADTVDLTRKVEQALADLAKALPPGVTADTVLFRQASFIEASISNVEDALRDAVIVVAIVLFAFLLNARTTLISLTAIPISILITVLVFRALGLSINTMTLGGLAIAIGELVDDAVVGVENVYRRLKENREAAHPRPVLAVVAAASQEVRSGIIYATLIIILVFIPLFALSGIEGRLFAPLGIAYIVSILGSLVTSITVTPVLCYYLIPRMRHLSGRESPLVRWLKHGDTKLLRWSFGHGGVLVGATLAAVIIACVVAVQLPRAFLPPFNEGTLTVAMTFTPGISLAEANRLGAIAERLVMKVPEVKSVGRRTGRAELDEHAEGVHSSELDVDLHISARPKEVILADIRQRLSILPASFNIGQPIGHRLEHMLSGVNAAIAIKIFGEDIDTLRGLAEQLRARLAAIPGLVDLVVERQVRVPQLQIRLDYQRAALFGVTPAAVTEALEQLVNGKIVSQIVDGQKRFDVVLRLADTARGTEALANLLVETPKGRTPLRNIADITDDDGPNQILRENGTRRIVVQANTDGSDEGRIIAAIRAEIAGMVLPPGGFIKLEGTFQAQEESARLIGLLSLVSLGLVATVLYSRYRSVVLAAIIMANVPLALIGSVAALWLFDQPLSVASMIGFITLTGISARNGILKISHYINLVLHEGEAFGPDMVVRGSLERLTPVLMTAISAGFALLPLMIGADAPGKEILHPVATVIFGGLISATLLDTLLTPLLFLRFGRPAVERLIADQAGSSIPADAF